MENNSLELNSFPAEVDKTDLVFSKDVYIIRGDGGNKKSNFPSDDSYEKYFYNPKSVLARSNLLEGNGGRQEYRVSKNRCFGLVAFVIVLTTCVTLAAVFLSISILRPTHEDNLAAELMMSPETVILLLDTDFPGMDFDKQMTSTALECHKICRDFGKCSHWTWIPKDATLFDESFYETCWLKRLSSWNKKDMHIQRRIGLISGIANNDNVFKLPLMRLVQEEFQHYHRA